MPTYVYRCEKCGTTREDHRAVADRATPMLCVRLGCCGVARFGVSAPAAVFPGAETWRTHTKATP